MIDQLGDVMGMLSLGVSVRVYIYIGQREALFTGLCRGALPSSCFGRTACPH